MSRIRRLVESPKFWSAALAGYWLTLFVATHVPHDFPAVPPDRVDKLVHVAVFAVLGWLLATAWQRSAGRLTARHFLAAWLVIVLYAAADEFSQPWVGRVCSLGDWLADAVGAAVGLITFVRLRKN
jgi:VanZ family protein